ncbi:General substrate transporter [Penicillium occitanis (nom. inval.)]|nr:General substrate transporter [Penicillium occitanis (nom. inval.)]PCG89250.1 hypothetical protein PENOC_107330 [Penicillium occitanis (nom. inval.)]
MKFSTATQAASSSIIWIGIAPFGRPLLDRYGRKKGILEAFVISSVGVALQTSAQNAAMFMIGRLILGMGVGLGSTACPTYAPEIAPTKYRAFMLGFYYDLCAGRQHLVLVVALCISGHTQHTLFGPVPFVPESPRWLVSQDKDEQALKVLAITLSNGDTSDSEVHTSYNQILASIALSKRESCFPELARRYQNSIKSEKNHAGRICRHYRQLQINVALNVWCLACAGVGTLLADKIRRKPLATGSLTFALIFLYLVGALTKPYGSSTDESAVFGTVTCIFLVQGGYSFGWTTLLVMYPSEVLSFSLRANGMAIYPVVSNAAGVFATFIMPFALEGIGWKTYMVNASWDVLEVVFVVLYWVETSKLSLEEIEEVFEMEMRLGAGNIIQAVDIEDAKTSYMPVHTMYPSNEIRGD